jgi:hypothetical protein
MFVHVSSYTKHQLHYVVQVAYNTLFSCLQSRQAKQDIATSIFLHTNFGKRVVDQLIDHVRSSRAIRSVASIRVGEQG